MNKYFSLHDKVYDITEQYPNLLNFLINNGFGNLGNDRMRKTIGKTISMETALHSKHLNIEFYEQRMVEVIEQNQSINPIINKKLNSSGEIKISGVLPCPIRLQLIEQLEQWLQEENINATLDLQAASMGLDWLRERIVTSENEDDLADIYLSAGFSLFFNQTIMGRYIKNQVFRDITKEEKLNPCFDNHYIDLKDPLGIYTIIGAVPAIFMVNTKLLGDRAFPESWEDLLCQEYENSIALPTRDLDLFNAVLLGIYNVYGEEGIKQLGRGLLRDMHPSQMIKNSKTKSATNPVVTIMPYFFTKMVPENSSLKVVWPKEGAIISPIFLLTKSFSQKTIQPIVDYLYGEEMGATLSVNGKFPSTHPKVENHLTNTQKFLWPGWNFIHSHDIHELLIKIERLFFEAVGGEI